jgi:tRNA A37 threonylcarbamoyladenosine biosynthesis protein TsaE
VLEGDNVSLIEWGDRFPGSLPPDVLTVMLTITGDESRHIAVTASGPRSRELADEWRAACHSVEGASVGDDGSGE